MSPGVMIAQGILVLAFVPLNILFWVRVMGRWQERFRRRCERRYCVTISHGGRGHWQVGGDRPWYRRAAIELLQLGYFMGAFLAWGMAMLLGVGLLSLFG